MKKILFIAGALALITLPANAELTVDDTVNGAYLKNHGYSDASIQIVNKKIAEANGEEYSKPIEHEYYETPVAKYVRKFFMYIDPALDDQSFSNNHQIHTAPNWYDL